MALVLVYAAEITDDLLVCATEYFHQFVVLRAEVFLQFVGGCHQLVFLKHGHFMMRLDVSFTVRDQTLQTGFDSFQFPSRAQITGHISRTSVKVVSRVHCESCPLQLLH